MLNIKVSQKLQNAYEQKFNNKIDYFKEDKKYMWLREYADQALSFHTGSGFFAIKAVDFMDRIIQLLLEYIQDWLDGKNQLEWKKY